MIPGIGVCIYIYAGILLFPHTHCSFHADADAQGLAFVIIIPSRANKTGEAKRNVAARVAGVGHLQNLKDNHAGLNASTATVVLKLRAHQLYLSFLGKAGDLGLVAAVLPDGGENSGHDEAALVGDADKLGKGVWSDMALGESADAHNSVVRAVLVHKRCCEVSWL